MVLVCAEIRSDSAIDDSSYGDRGGGALVRLQCCGTLSPVSGLDVCITDDALVHQKSHPAQQVLPVKSLKPL